MLDDNLRWLIEWYNAQCDGIWENTHGIEVINLGNPGWTIRIDIEKTDLQHKKFQENNIDRTETDWAFCCVKEGYFEGNCGTLNISEVFQTFRNWAESTFEIDKGLKLDDNFLWLVNWFDSQCDGYWEGSFRIQIKTNENSNWSVIIKIEETELEDKYFEDISIKRTETDWFNCKIENGSFRGTCSTFNLIELLKMFSTWAKS